MLSKDDFHTRTLIQTQNTLRTCDAKQVSFKINLEFTIAVYQNKCLKQIKLPISLYMLTLISKLLSNLSTMGFQLN